MLQEGMYSIEAHHCAWRFSFPSLIPSVFPAALLLLAPAPFLLLSVAPIPLAPLPSPLALQFPAPASTLLLSTRTPPLPSHIQFLVFALAITISCSVGPVS